MEKKVNDLLRELGFTQYETSAILTLIKNGPSSAERISSFGKVPLPRVYDTMDRLIKAGLVTVSRSRPQIFTLVELKQVFELLKHDEKKKIDEKIKSIDKSSKKLINLIGRMKINGKDVHDNESIIIAKRESNMSKLWAGIHNNSSKEVLIFAGDLSWTRRKANKIKSLVKQGVDHKIIWSKLNALSKKNVKRIADFVNLRYSREAKDLRAMIIDGNKLLFSHMTNKALKTTKNEYKVCEEDTEFTTYVITNSIIVDVFRNYFLSVWKTGLIPEKVLKE